MSAVNELKENKLTAKNNIGNNYKYGENLENVLL